MTTLDEIPAKWWTPDPSVVAKLPRGGNGTPGSCNVCGGWHKQGAIHLDYVGHADLTRALIEIDPQWNWEPLAFGADGLPLVTERKNQLVLWGRLTLLGQTRLCVGTCEAAKGDAEKELIGDLLRNGGMRFGVFGSLWSKSSGWDQFEDEPAAPRSRARSSARVRNEAAPVPEGEPLSFDELAILHEYFEGLPDDVRAARKKAFAAEFGTPQQARREQWSAIEAWIGQ